MKPQPAFSMIFVIAACCLLLARPGLAEGQMVETENYQIPAADPGIQLFIRNKHPGGVTNFPGEKFSCSFMAQRIPPRRLLTYR